MTNSTIEIKVCLGTSGKAAGGEEVMGLFQRLALEQGVEAQVGKRCSYVKVGCRGFCSKDALVDVIIDGHKTTYQSVKPIMVERIVREHVLGGVPVAAWTTKEDYASFHAKSPSRDSGAGAAADFQRARNGASAGHSRKARSISSATWVR